MTGVVIDTPGVQSLSPVTVPRYRAHYRVVLGSNPQTAAPQTLDSGLYLELCVMVHWWLWSPPLSPPRDYPARYPPARAPCLQRCV